MLPWFPVVGMILGGLWAGFDAMVGWVFPSALRGALDAFFLVLLSGGLHLDGLADTADGLLNHGSRDTALEIMKDSRIGTWGALALLAVLGFKTLALSQPFLWDRNIILICTPVYGRVAMLIGIWVLPYGRQKGMASDLFNGSRGISLLPGVIILGLGSILLEWPGPVLINGLFIGVVALLLGFFWLRVRCVTGDMLGALGEITEAALLVAVAADG